MEIRQITTNKRDFMPLLLLGDEQESLVEEYLDPCALFALYLDRGPLAVCAVTEEEQGIFELRNLAVDPCARRQGCGRLMVEVAAAWARSQGGHTLLAGTGDAPVTVSFYRACGFRERGREKDYFLTRYDHPILEDGVLLRDRVVFERRA